MMSLPRVGVGGVDEEYIVTLGISKNDHIKSQLYIDMQIKFVQIKS